MEQETPGVQTLRGHPKRAILRLSLPMMAAIFVQARCNMVDAIWVSGLGVGGSSAVSRRIGAREKLSAERAALLTLALGFFFSILFFLGLPLAPPMFTGLGATGEAARGAGPSPHVSSHPGSAGFGRVGAGGRAGPGWDAPGESPR